MQLTIDRFGRMVLPTSMREDLGLEPGDKLEASEEGGSIVPRPLREADALQCRHGVLVYCGQPVGDVADAVRKQRQERMRRAAGAHGRP